MISLGVCYTVTPLSIEPDRKRWFYEGQRSLSFSAEASCDGIANYSYSLNHLR